MHYYKDKADQQERRGLITGYERKGCDSHSILMSVVGTLYCMLILGLVVLSYFSYHWSKEKQVKWVARRNGDFPHDAVLVTSASANGTYSAVVIRARTEGAVTPGKLIPGKTYATIGWNNKEIRVKHYEVLTDPDKALCWIPSTSEAMDHAILGGFRELGLNLTLLIARVVTAGILTPGKQWKELGTCAAPFNGTEFFTKKCDILTFCSSHRTNPLMYH